MRNKPIIKNEDERFVLGEVYIPDVLDAQDEFMRAETIRKMAHSFMASNKSDMMDINHNKIKSGNIFVESFIARENDPDGFVSGSWVLGAYILNDAHWQAVKDGRLNGWSWQGDSITASVGITIDDVEELNGTTEEYEGHVHTVSIKMSDNKVIPCVSGYADGHTHVISKTTATELTNGHAHRLVIEWD